MNMRADLTIAIPTYNRCESVEQAVLDALPTVEAGEVSLLVIDDGGSDDTFERLTRYERDGVRILRNETNLGYAGTFCRIFREADTEWVMVSADDDRLDLTRWPDLKQFLRTEQPTFVSTQFRVQRGAMLRGRDRNGPIRARDLRHAAGHAPGLVYPVPAARLALPLLEDHLRRGSQAAHTYPQMVVAAQLVADGQARWWAGELVREGSALPSGLNDTAGRHYADAQSRVAQAFDFDRLYREMAAASPRGRARRSARTWVRDNNRLIYPAIRTAALTDHPEIDGELMDRSVRRYFRRTTWRTFVKGLPGVRAIRGRTAG
jgi:hypothetical protein